MAKYFAEGHTPQKVCSLLCDPPYELGFMGKSWDKSGIPFQSSTWAALAKHLHPGAFIFAFASSRGWHRQAVAMEDAGLVIHPTLFGFLFASGFPKATRVPDERFNGHRYGLQAIKPALEPIIVAQKPYVGKPVESITRTGSGALNIDAGRIATEDNLNGGAYAKNGTDRYDGYDNWRFKRTGRSKLAGDERDDVAAGMYAEGSKCDTEFVQPSGRWPANFYLGDEEAARRLDEQSGIRKSCQSPSDAAPEGQILGGRRCQGTLPMDAPGGASRFFFRVQEQIDEADPVHYCPKASRSEREAGLDGFESQERRTLGKGLTGVSGDRTGTGKKSDIPMGESKVKCNHPCVKPIQLTTWLAKLLLPPGEYAPRRLLVPFAGVLSECIGAMNAGWEEVVAIEQSAEYLEIGKARAEYYQNKLTEAQKSDAAPLFDIAE
jgi:hypothetical protein